jgi:hypothetical protein
MFIEGNIEKNKKLSPEQMLDQLNILVENDFLTKEKIPIFYFINKINSPKNK